MKSRKSERILVAGEMSRPRDGIVWHPATPVRDLPVTGQHAWQSNGGTLRGHPARSLPFSTDIRVPDHEGRLDRIHLVGVFSLFGGAADEAYGTVGATAQLFGDRDILFRQDLVNGRHYGDALDGTAVCRVIGDGSSLETIGTCQIQGQTARVDVLTLDVNITGRARHLQVKDLGSPASFVIFDVLFEFEQGATCPFKGKSGGVSLADLGAAIRIGDRLKFARAVDQLDSALDDADDLDEVRGQALTFLAVVSAGVLELGGSREIHRLQLHAARELDRLTTRDEIKDAIRELVLQVTDGLFTHTDGPTDKLVDRALAIVERHFAKDLTDAMVAAQLGLSTSHFRYLFRQATGYPFHKYVVALRLEKARQMLIEQELPVSQVATAVGFTGLSHFSRAFTQRFQASPSHIRRAAG